MRAPSAHRPSMREIAAASMPRFSLLGAAAAFVVALLLAATAGLWMHYGTAVFYEMIVAGLAACL